MWQPTLEDALKYVFFASVYRATQMAMIRSKWGLDGLVSNLQIVGSQIVI
jgi:hypothetical protein